MDYVDRHYHISLHSIKRVMAPFYASALPPTYETLHNPYTFEQRAAECELPNCEIHSQGIRSYKQPEPLYKPYHGQLRGHFDRFLEANRTKDPYYRGFFMVTNSTVYRFDPRPAKVRVTALERVWGGPAQRFHW